MYKNVSCMPIKQYYTGSEYFSGKIIKGIVHLKPH